MEQRDPDHELMCRIAQRDTDAYRELVGKYLNFCVRFAERMLNNRQDAEDITQEVCLKIWNEAPRWQPRAKFSTWLYRVMINACIDHQRKIVPFANVEMEDIFDYSPAVDDAMIEKQSAIKVRQALQKIPERQRAALILSYYEEVSNQQAAETMGIQIVAFQQLLFRARQNLKEYLIEYKSEKENA